ncbi:MAG TPA: hypothetical protein PLB62_16495, partial [Candidatus Sumerlaeota bacterium]|nr:hypothetical protein [Candidatus Sumerlaeota bacterium]
HPPLDKRIRTIDPSWDGTFPKIEYAKFEEKEAAPKKTLHLDNLPGMPRGVPGAGVALLGAPVIKAAIPAAPLALVRTVGALTPESITHASTLLRSLPDELRTAARTRDGAAAIVFSALMDRTDPTRQAQWDGLVAKAPEMVMRHMAALLTPVEIAGPPARLALISLSFPALKATTGDFCRMVVENAERLAEADEKISLFEYAVTRLLKNHLEPVITGQENKAPVEYYSLTALLPDVALLLSALTISANPSKEEQERAYSIGVARLSASPESMPMIQAKDLDIRRIDAVLGRLRRATPGIKRRVIESLAFAAALDKQISVEEAEVLRVVADTLDCPIPPIAAQAA